MVTLDATLGNWPLRIQKEVKTTRTTTGKMSPSKRRKVDTEQIVFLDAWTNKYLFTEVSGNPTCLACTRQQLFTYAQIKYIFQLRKELHVDKHIRSFLSSPN